MRTSNKITKGPDGLDVQGFTYLEHSSALSGEDWFVGTNIEEIYVPEIIQLICTVTGAKRAVVDSMQIRRRAANAQEEQNIPNRKGQEHDQIGLKLARDTVRGKFPAK
jgi:hypothetical protein